MKSRNTTLKKRKQLAALLMCLVLTAGLLPQYADAAADKTVRVGWFESSFNTTDKLGRRSGYAYEYQLKIASYTGWSYEYIQGSWSELMRMLIDGEIDLLSDVSYTEERSELMLFPELPMGAEEYFVFTAPDNKDISLSDPATLNGKRVGVNKGSIQVNLYRDWAERNGVSGELIEVTTSEDESLSMLENGELDAYVTADSFTNPERAAPVFKVGSSDYFFAVSNSRPDLLTELNSAMSRIQDENRFFNQHLFERYMKTAGAHAFLSPAETEWLAEHGKIRVGYLDNYLAFCAADSSGQLTGAMKDYLEKAETCLVNGKLSFEPIAYTTVEAAIRAVENGEADCMFPINFSGYDSEKSGVVMSPTILYTDIFAVVRQSDLNAFSNKQYVVAAVNQGNVNYDAFLLDYYPSWKKVYYETTEECLKAVSDSVADCVLVSGYRYNNLSRLCNKYRLTTFPTGVDLELCFAVKKGNIELYSILAKAVNQIPSSAVNSALSYYITEDAKLTLGDFIADNLALATLITGAVMLFIILLMVRSMRAEKRAKALIAATETDALTGLYNRDYFFQYANRMRREHPDAPMDAIVMNIEQFHTVNALNGREFGDQVLRVLGNEIRLIAEETGGIAGRFGADRFDLYCKHEADCQAIFDRLQKKLDVTAPNASIRLRMGVMRWQKELEPIQMFDRARTACSMARGNFTQRLIVFDEKMRERELLEQRLMGDLRRALDEFEFEVHYQPKYDIQFDPPKIVSTEALVRWHHPELGMIPPDKFIPMLERNGKIGEVDKYVWTQAARQVARWRAQFGVTLPVSVNLSRVDIFDPELENTLEAILSQNGLEHDALKLEVTETAYTDNAQHLIQVVESLRGKGYTVEMDDFGTGYSSLNMLSAMPIDVLKMDKTFIQNIENNEKDTQLVALILGTAKSLNIPVVAEGVETESQMLMLKRLGCTIVQGYFLSKPLHPSEFETYLLKNIGR